MNSPRKVRSLQGIVLVGLGALLLSAPALAETVHVAQPAGEVGLALRGQSPAGVTLHFGLDRFDLTPVAVAGERMQAVTLAGVLLPNDAGAPDLPGLGRYVAVPRGATARLTVVSARTEVLRDMAIAPAPVLPAENDDRPLIYERTAAIYERNAPYPAEPVRLSEPMVMRGVDAVIVGITPFQYNPITRELVIYTELELRIDFVGGSGVFGDPRLRSRFWEPILRGHLLNYESLPAPEFPSPADGGRDGYEYVIITPTDAGFVGWANMLQSWRQLQGISTGVFTTATTGTTATAIESWLNNAYNTWAVPPAAFLILGDYPSSGDGRDVAITSPIWNSYCVSDNIYADVNGDNLPDMAHARICARTSTELGAMITKMLDYEQNPYTDPDFYDQPIIAGGWQTERWFILCTEVCFGFQANVLGKHPVREYAIYSGTPGTSWSTATNTSTVVNYFGPNGLGYIPATPQHLTDWGGNATRINADINAGAYMLLHRDHGYEYGWGEPAYSTTSLNGLTNVMYPFVFTINCLTGKYDYSSETFAEKFHRIAHGALGLIAPTEVSYSFVNDTFVWGLMDGMWEGFMPTYGPYPHGPDPLRTCFGMCYGKYFLQASSWPYNTSNKTVTYHLFHHHGDAFLRLQTEVPQNLSVAHEDHLCEGVTFFTIQAGAGALISLTANGAILGVAEATGAAQEITIPAQTAGGSLRIVVTAPNRYRYDVQVPITNCTGGLVADFSGVPTSGCAPLTVAFTDASSGGEITSWSWTFGDGGTSTAQSPTHEYASPDVYTVSLTATGPLGTDTETKTGYITVTGPPVAAFSGAPTYGTAPLTVAFTDLSTGNPTAWGWNFGDTGTSAEQNPIHQYIAAGDYTVTLTASNTCGSDGETKTAYIHVTQAVPIALALADIPVAGTVTGNYTYTHVSDNIREVIREVPSGTGTRWYSMLEHRWRFEVTAGTSATFHVEGYRPNNSDSDNFAFEYSTDGTNFTRVVTISSSTERLYSAALPPGLSGSVHVRVIDTNRKQRKQSLDSIYIDAMDITTARGAGAPLVALPMGSGADGAPYSPEDGMGEVFGLAGTPTTWTRGVQSLRFTLIEPARVELTLYSVTGRRVVTLVDGWHPAGSHSVRYDTTGLTSGVYFCRLQAGDASETRKLMLVH